MDECEVFINEAIAVGLKAIEQGIARTPLSEQKLRKSAEELISNSRKQTELQIKEGLIKKPPS
jgi:malate dehydrogenase (oxaloacetate-decarboxylating)